MKKDNGIMVFREVTDTLPILASDSSNNEVRVERVFAVDTYINPFPGVTSLIKANPRIVKLIDRVEEYINAKAVNVYIDNYDTTSIAFDCTEKSDASKLSSLIEKNKFTYLTTKDDAEVFYFKILSHKCENTEIELNSKFWIFDELLLFSSLIKEELKKEKKTQKKKETKEKGKEKKDSSKKKNKKK